jgi:hypothetical protein
VVTCPIDKQILKLIRVAGLLMFRSSVDAPASIGWASVAHQKIAISPDSGGNRTITFTNRN